MCPAGLPQLTICLSELPLPVYEALSARNASHPSTWLPKRTSHSFPAVVAGEQLMYRGLGGPRRPDGLVSCCLSLPPW